MNKLLALILLIIFLPIILSVSFLILIFDQQNPIFIQKRLGLNRQLFTIYKFQTFKNNQITTLGRILRKTGVDEIPQLFNIIINNINFIGPRPLTQIDVNRLGWTSSFYDKRWSVKPGLTGLAQLSPICHKKMTLFWDNYYAKHQNFKLNFKILIATSFILIFGKRKVINFIHNK